MNISTIKDILDGVVTNAGQIILGKEHQLRLAITCLIARGHLLIEDLPGVGKTTLAHVLARALGLHFQRVQFTNDLLPADILGSSVYDRDKGGFKFHPGAIFANVVLADEVNRATPKTQSALLEAMEEQQVTIDSTTYKLPSPFFVIATQNPTHQVGTFALPESQLDRFLMRLGMGYPDRQAERALLTGQDRRELLHSLQPSLTMEQLLSIQGAVAGVHVSDALLDYLQLILEFSRKSPSFQSGLSPRAGLALLRAAQAWALMEGKMHVLPEHVQLVLPHVVHHRLQAGGHSNAQQTELVAQLLALPIP